MFIHIPLYLVQTISSPIIPKNVVFVPMEDKVTVLKIGLFNDGKFKLAPNLT